MDRYYTTALLMEVFPQRYFVADFIPLKLNFIFKNKKLLFEPLFWWLRGNVRTPSIGRWKARVDFLFVIIKRSSLSLTVETLSAEICQSRSFSKGVFYFGRKFQRKGRRPPTTVGVGKLEWLPFRMVSKYPQCIVWFCHKARVWRTDGQTDRRTDGRTEIRQLIPC